MFRTALVAVSAAFFAIAVHAEETGEVVVEIDGESHGFPLWADQSDWSGSAQYASVNIYARPADGGTSERFGTFTLGFEITGDAASNGELTLTRMVDGEREKLFAGDEAEAGGLRVSLDSVAMDGEELAITGRFTSEMGTSENYGRDIDLVAPVAVSGRFDLVLGPVE